MDIRIPKLGEGADSGTVATVFVKVGDTIKKDDPIVELESEKAVASIPSPASGRVTKVLVKQGDTVKVGQVIITLSAEAMGVSESSPPSATSTSAASKGTNPPEIDEPIIEEAEELHAAAAKLPPAAAPTVRKVARELGIDLSRVRGTDRGGRISMADLRAYIQRLQKLVSEPKRVAQPVEKKSVETIDFSVWGKISKQPMTPLRQVIARRMTESWQHIPHVTQFEEVDITDLMALRKKFLPIFEKRGAYLTLTPFVLRAVVATLKNHPIFNTSLDESSNQIIFKEYFHIGVAVDTEHGLLVPVIRDVDKKNLLQLSKELEELAEKAKQRKLTAEEMRGGSFTISNQGGIGGAHFTPIINRPEVAILGIGRGALKPVVLDKKIEQRVMLPLGLSYDHRVIDGANAARFIVDFAQNLQSFAEADIKI